MYEIRFTKTYRKSYTRVSQYKNFDSAILETVIDVLQSGKTLPQKYRDHQLSGALKEYRECHIKSDILLVYQKYDDVLILLLVDIGSHSSLF